MEPETTLPSLLPALSTPSSTLGHYGDVFTAREASLTVWDRQQLSVASPPHFLASQTTPLPNLAIGLRPLHGSWWALGSSLQPTTSQNSCLPSGFQPMSNQQHDTQKWSALPGETSQSK